MIVFRKFNLKFLNLLLKKKILFLKKNKLKSSFLKSLHIYDKDFKPFCKHLIYKYKISRKLTYFYNKKIDKLLRKFWQFYWYNLFIYLKLCFLFPYFSKKASFINNNKKAILHFFLLKEYICFKNPISYKYLMNKAISLNKKKKLYKLRVKNYYNFFDLPINSFVHNLNKTEKNLKKAYIISYKNIDFLKKLQNDKNIYKQNIHILYSLYIFQKNKDLFEMETFYFKQFKYNYKLLGHKHKDKVFLLNTYLRYYLRLLLSNYIKILLIPFNFRDFPKKILKFLLKKNKKKKFKKTIFKSSIFKPIFKKPLKKFRFPIIFTKKQLIWGKLALLDKIFLINKTKTNAFIFIKKTFSNIFITLTDLNLKVIVCKTSTIAGIKGNKRRKVAPQAIEYIVSSLMSYNFKTVYICLNLYSFKIRKYLYNLLRELNLNNIIIKGFFRFNYRAHNGVRGRTFLKKI